MDGESKWKSAPDSMGVGAGRASVSPKRVRMNSTYDCCPKEMVRSARLRVTLTPSSQLIFPRSTSSKWPFKSAFVLAERARELVTMVKSSVAAARMRKSFPWTL